ncbi:MAG: fasciclin domain-containing protein, partial [Myxococcota bacterium]
SAELLDAVSDPAADLTVFAPTNQAFTDAGDVSPDALPGILLYHTVSGSVLSGEVPASAPSGSTNEAGNSLTLLFDTTDGVRINDSASVAEGLADIRATNGVVHVIDGVLLPLSAAGAATAAGLTELLSVVDFAADIETDVSVADALTGPGTLTVFAPTNAAFEEASGTVEGLSEEQARDVLLYHVAGAIVLAGDLSDGPVPTLNGGAEVEIVADPPSVNGEGIVATDINVTNGVVHLIDGVLIPPSLRE